MKFKKLYFLTFFIFNVLLAHAQHDGEILWEEGRKLIWSDFTEVTSNVEYAAASSISVHYTICKRSIWNGKVVLKVECIFYKSNSLVSKQKTNSLTLRHEQLHFDIGELFARKLRMEFATHKLNVDNVDAQAKRLYDKVLLEYMTFQRMFDIDTQHGTEKDKQLKWEKRVEEELKSLENYKNNNC